MLLFAILPLLWLTDVQFATRLVFGDLHSASDLLEIESQVKIAQIPAED